MKATITAHHDSTHCCWCEKDAEGVTVQFDGGFLTGELCWKCLQQATRVHAKQHGADKQSATNVPTTS